MIDRPKGFEDLTPGRDFMQEPQWHKIEAEVDEEIWAFLEKRRKEGFTLNEVLRRLFGFE